MSRTIATTTARDYNAAVAALNTLQSNSKVVAEIRKHGRSTNDLAIPEMLEWFQKMGYAPSDFNKLNLIHVAGTKGKGSTSAFISSILAQYGGSTSKSTPGRIGLFTSPHLRFVRERIQIDNEPISEGLFAKYFFEVWDKLSSTGDGSKPMYFRFLTIMAFHAFLEEKIGSAVIECGIGGEYDSTNIIEKPTVSAISALGIDHEALLGTTLPEIAWHKAGIFKSGAVALTIQQPAPAMEVLRNRADQVGEKLQVMSQHPQIQSGEVKLGLAAEYQKSNASLAVAAVSAHLRTLGHFDIPDLLVDNTAILPHEFVNGLQQVKWPGRSQIKYEPATNTTWYLDGAHTLESVELSAGWFANEVQQYKESSNLVLIFNQQSRDAVALIKALHMSVAPLLGSSPFLKAIFTTNVTYGNASYKSDLVSINNDSRLISDLVVQEELARAWKVLDSQAEIKVTASIQEAVAHAQIPITSSGANRPNRVLVIGSLHTVGGVLEILESSESAAVPAP
jgi:folylpolyglutamate synthase